MKRLIPILFAALLWGCGKELPECLPCDDPQEGKEEQIAVRFTMSAEQPVEMSRATNEHALSNIQLLLIGTGGRYYFTPPNAAAYQATIKRGTYTIYAVANCPTSIQQMDAGQLTSFYASFRDGDSSIPLGFTATATFGAGNSTYPIALVRSAAKLKFNVTSNSIKLTSWQLCSVATGAAILPGGSPGSQAFTDMAEVSLNNSGSLKSFSFSAYVPENLAGTINSITDQRQRTHTNAPAKATYLKLEGELSDKTHVEYRIYLGSNETSDFNIRRNHDYQININVLNASTADARISSCRFMCGSMFYMTKGNTYLASPNGYVLYPGFVTNSPDIFPSVDYTLAFSGCVPGTMYVNGVQAVGNIYKGRLVRDEEHQLEPFYDVPYFTSSNNRVTYTLTIADAYDNTSLYSGEVVYANRVYAYASQYPGAGTISFPNGNPNSTSNQGDWNRHMAHYVGTPCRMTAVATYGHFKGWYRDRALTQLYSTSATIDWDAGVWDSEIYASFIE